MRSISLTVNGRQITRDLDPEMPLLYLLSDDLALRGPKFGCGQALCGSCTVTGEREGGQVLRDAGRHGRGRRDH